MYIGMWLFLLPTLIIMGATVVFIAMAVRRRKRKPRKKIQYTTTPREL